MTDMTIAGFLAQFKDGISRPNKYRVEFTLPSGVRVGEGEIGVNNDARVGAIQRMNQFFNSKGGINVKCHTMTFPQRSILAQQVRQNSAPFNTPYSANYDPVTFSFYNNSAMDARDYFEVWQSSVVNLGTNTMNFYDEYVSDVHMYMLDQYGKDAYKVTLFEAWPLNVGIVDTSYSQSNAFTTTTVTLAFKSWSPKYNNSTSDVSGGSEDQ